MGFPFHTIQVEGQAIEDGFLRATYMHDEPLIHQNDPHLIAISAYAKQYVSVLLSGEGSDELMGGYVRYRALGYQNLLKNFGWILNVLPESSMNNRLKKLKKFNALRNPKIQSLWNAANYYPTDYQRYGLEYAGIQNNYRYKILDEAESLYGKNAFRNALYLDQHTYLCSLNNRNDRTTMAASIECREPFLDYRLIAGLGSLDDKWLMRSGVGKHILRQCMSLQLGTEVTRFRKIGFSIPWQATLDASPLLQELWEKLPEHPSLQTGILGDLNVQQIKKDYANGNTFLEVLLRQLLMFALWYDSYMLKKLT